MSGLLPSWEDVAKNVWIAELSASRMWITISVLTVTCETSVWSFLDFSHIWYIISPRLKDFHFQGKERFLHFQGALSLSGVTAGCPFTFHPILWLLLQLVLLFFFPWQASAKQCTLTERRMIIVRKTTFQFLISSPSLRGARSEEIFQSPMSPSFSPSSPA